ncbi:MAG: glycosyltransferase family 4 protein [Acidimicrobiales bacterium]
MRIALLPSQYFPSLGGVEELTRNLAANLSKSGDEVEVWAPAPEIETDTPTGTEHLDGIRVRRFRYALPRANPASLAPLLVEGLPTLGAMLRAVVDFQPDVINVQCFGPNGVYATALSMLTGLPLVVSLQGETLMDDSDIYTISATMRASLRAGIGQAKRVTGCSAFTLRDAEARFGLEPGAGQVIFNDANPDLIGTREEMGLPDRLEFLAGTRYVACLGRVVDNKGFDLLLDAFNLIRSDHPGVHLVVGGSGSKLEDLRRLAGRLGLSDRVHFPGRLSRYEVAQVLTSATVFVMPSRLEPFGIVVLEAWRAGTAVIATSIGGPPEFVSDGADGLLVDPHDTRQLADALARLLDDDELRQRIALAGKVRFRDFEWPNLTFEYRKLYSGAVSARHPLRSRLIRAAARRKHSTDQSPRRKSS